jgi:DNA-directed RNA polymerase specialized sigma subunit
MKGTIGHITLGGNEITVKYSGNLSEEVKAALLNLEADMNRRSQLIKTVIHRYSHGFSQQQIADHTNVSRHEVRRILSTYKS